MMRRLVVVALIVAVVTTSVAVPRRAAASDNLQYIIPAAISGVLVVALVVAILMADRTKEPELDLIQVPPRTDAAPPVRFGLACRRPSGEMPLLCW